MREWVFVISPVAIVIYFVFFPQHLNALMAIAMRFMS